MGTIGFITIGYLVNGVMSLVVLYYAVKLWRLHPVALSVLILIPLIFLWLDNFAIALGQFIGEGPFLTSITYIRFYWHWQMLPLLMIVAGILLRNADFAFAQKKFVMGLFCVVAVGFMVLDVPYIFQVEFYPACYGETVRLTINVPANQICDPANPPPEGISVAPIPALGVTLALTAVGFALWARHAFPWLALTGLFMFAAGGLQQVPDFHYGPLLGNFGEPIFNAGLLAAAYRFAQRPQGDAGSQAAEAPVSS